MSSEFLIGVCVTGTLLGLLVFIDIVFLCIVWCNINWIKIKILEKWKNRLDKRKRLEYDWSLI